MNTIQNLDFFNQVAMRIETFNHNNLHGWIGGPFGTMTNVSSSPGDPTFYFHHTMTDYAWQRWLDVKWNGNDYENISNSLQPSVNNQPMYNPRTLFDNRALKLWYATEGVVHLKNYTVSNQTLGVHTGPEFYFYTGKIQVATTPGQHFTVPAWQQAKMESMTEIALLPGFSAEAGAHFGAEIISTFPTGFGSAVRRERSIEELNIENSVDSLLAIAPNPSGGEFFIKSLKPYTLLGLFNLAGQRVEYTQSNHRITMLDPRAGVYILVVVTDNGRRYSKKLIVE